MRLAVAVMCFSLLAVGCAKDSDAPRSAKKTRGNMQEAEKAAGKVAGEAGTKDQSAEAQQYAEIAPIEKCELTHLASVEQAIKDVEPLSADVEQRLKDATANSGLNQAAWVSDLTKAQSSNDLIVKKCEDVLPSAKYVTCEIPQAIKAAADFTRICMSSWKVERRLEVSLKSKKN
jgi:hypothetical protein